MNPNTEKQDIFVALRARLDDLEAELEALVAKRKAKKAEITNTRRALRVLTGESARRKAGEKPAEAPEKASEKGSPPPSQPPAKLPTTARLGRQG